MSESSSPELSVVCKNCGAENSPYVTECPYCGNRLRRRAPKLERVGDEVRVQETRRDKSRRRAAERRARRSERDAFAFAESIAMPWVAIAAVAVPAIALIIGSAVPFSVFEMGAIVGAPGIDIEPWRYVAAPFVYDNPGYLFACGLAVVLFLGAVERRVGPFPALLLALATGALGMLGAVGIEDLLGSDLMVAGGGNGMALGALGAWWAIRRSEIAADPDDEGPWPIAIVVSAAVLLALPAVVELANVWAGLVGGIVGLALGAAAAAGRRRGA